ncbi:MAG: peptidoglycan-binding domain-containing protein [Thermoleophilaceae bacterium]
MRRLTTPLLATLAVCALPGAASAQVPPPDAPSPAPAPPARAGKVTIKVSGGQATRKLRYVAKGARIRVSGTVRPFVAGQTVVLEVLRRKKVVLRRRIAVGASGRVRTHIRTRRRGLLKLRFRHAATPAQRAFSSRSRKVRVVSLRAGRGSRGVKVLLLQRGLHALGFAVPRTGVYDGGTARAVLAFRKTNGMGRAGSATRGVYSKVLRRRGAFRSPLLQGGTPRGVRLVAPGARPLRSEGKGLARLPRLVGQAVHAHGIRPLPLLPPRSRDQREGHGRRLLLHRRLRHPRLQGSAPLRGQPRLHPGSDPQRAPDP